MSAIFKIEKTSSNSSISGRKTKMNKRGEKLKRKGDRKSFRNRC
jgi:hypothetical protein